METTPMESDGRGEGYMCAWSGQQVGEPNLVFCWPPHSGDEALLEIGCEAREGPHQSIHGACGQISRYVLCSEATDRIEAKRITAPGWRLRPRKHGRGVVGRLWAVTHTVVATHTVHGL